MMERLHTLLRTIPDTRPYPQVAAKNELLRYAAHIADNASAAQVALAREQLRAAIHTMLAENHYLSLSVALSMVASPAQYRILWQALGDALSAQSEQEIQWLAWPVVVVIGAQQAGRLTLTVPQEKLTALLARHPQRQHDAAPTWLPRLVDGDTLSQINAGEWFAAKQSPAAAANLMQKLSAPDFAYAAGQEVTVLYALAYGNAAWRRAAGKNLDDTALPLMQLWQETFAADGLTVFANPLAGDVPAAAQTTASAMRQRMACDVFTANALRSIRLQQPRAAVVIAAREGGTLLFSFHGHEADELPPLNFIWRLAPGEDIPVVVQHFLDLLAECRVEHVRVLQEILFEQETAPGYRQALQRQGFNPFFLDA